MSNLAQRVLVGIVAIPIILLLCMAGGVYFFVFVAAVSAVALHEFYRLAAAKGAKPMVALGLIAGFAINLSFFLGLASQPPLVVTVLLITVIAFGLRELFRNEGSAILNLSTTLLGVVYISLFFGTFIGIRQLFVAGSFPAARFLSTGSSVSDAQVAHQIHAWGGYMVISVFATIWICDSAAFHVGAPWGKHKLFPRVSPNKSWEGAIAGLVFAILAAVGCQVPPAPLSTAERRHLHGRGCRHHRPTW